MLTYSDRKFVGVFALSQDTTMTRFDINISRATVKGSITTTSSRGSSIQESVQVVLRGTNRVIINVNKALQSISLPTINIITNFNGSLLKVSAGRRA